MSKSLKICDVEWQGDDSPLQKMYDRLAEMASEHTILAVVMDKKQKSPESRWRRLEKQNIGKRKFEIYEPLPLL